MAEDCLFFNKDSIVIKPQKKNPLLLRMIVLALVMISGVYICSVCLKQRGISFVPNLMKVEEIELPCSHPNISQDEVPFVHYPQPVTYRRNECRCTPVRFFAILSMQRSGSGWFETLLNSHINVSSNGEIFSVKERRSNISSITMTMDKIYNLDWLSSAAKNECTAAVGFKWMLNQVLYSQLPLSYYCIIGKIVDILGVKISSGHSLAPERNCDVLQRELVKSWDEGLMKNHEEIVSYFNRKGVSAIFLFRRNLLRRLVSILSNEHDRNVKQLNGTHKAHVHSKDEADVLARYKPTIDSTKLIPTLNENDKWAMDALEYFKSTRHIVLYYEDLVNNRTKLMNVLEFLRVPQRKLVSRHVKIHTRPLSEQVENWDTISTTLKGTKYETFLQSDYRT